MELFKAHFIHPYTQMPLIIYYNKSDGHVTFEKDIDVINILYQLENKLSQDQKFLLDMQQTSHILKTQYPVKTFDEVYELLKGLGVDQSELKFKKLFVH